MTPETRQLTCGLAKKPVPGIKKQTLLRRISRATRRRWPQHDAGIAAATTPSSAAAKEVGLPPACVRSARAIHSPLRRAR